MKKNIAFVLMITMSLSVILNENITNVVAREGLVTRKSITIIKGHKKQLKLNKKSKITWKSSNNKVASVNKKGVVKAKKIGKARITARFSGKIVQYNVKVIRKEKPAQPESSNIPAASSPVLTAVPTPTCWGMQTLKPTPLVMVQYWKLDNKEITTATKNISGMTLEYSDDTILKISVEVNGEVIAEKSFEEKKYNEIMHEYMYEFSLDVDFSNCNMGDKIYINRMFFKANAINNDPKFSSFCDAKLYILKSDIEIKSTEAPCNI